MPATPATHIMGRGFIHAEGKHTLTGAAIIVPDIDAEIDTTDAATLCGVSVATIRTWVHRGLLTATGINDRGRPIYRLIDVAKAERSTRERARR